MSSGPDLSVVIVSYQSQEFLPRCLASLENARRDLNLEVFVVDNASSDSSVEFVKSNFSDVVLICNETNVGFARANNQALRLTSGRHVLLLNPDTELKSDGPNPLEILVEFMDQHPSAGACGPRLEFGDGSFQHSAFHFPSLLQVYFDLFPPNWRIANSRLNGRYPRRLYDSGKPFLIDHPLGAALMVRRSAAEKTGWLDENYFIYVEELDWCFRLKRAGWQIWCVPAAEILHFEGQSAKQFPDRMFVELWKSRRIFFSKNYSSSFNTALAALVRFGMSRKRAGAKNALRAGILTQQEYDARVEAFAAVSRLYSTSNSTGQG